VYIPPGLTQESCTLFTLCSVCRWQWTSAICLYGIHTWSFWWKLTLCDLLETRTAYLHILYIHFSL